MAVKSILEQASPSGDRGENEALCGIPINTWEGTCLGGKDQIHKKKLKKKAINTHYKLKPLILRKGEPLTCIHTYI